MMGKAFAGLAVLGVAATIYSGLQQESKVASNPQYLMNDQTNTATATNENLPTGNAIVGKPGYNQTLYVGNGNKISPLMNANTSDKWQTDGTSIKALTPGERSEDMTKLANFISTKVEKTTIEHSNPMVMSMKQQSERFEQQFVSRMEREKERDRAIITPPAINVTVKDVQAVIREDSEKKLMRKSANISAQDTAFKMSTEQEFA